MCLKVKTGYMGVSKEGIGGDQDTLPCGYLTFKSTR